MSDVWDRASEVMAGRRGILASIALLFVWLPALVRGAATLAAQGSDPAQATASGGAALGLGLLGLVAALLAAIGHMALIAVASDPAVGRGEAIRVALSRLLPYIGIVALIVLILGLLSAPLFVAIASGYPSVAAMQAGGPPQLSPGTGLFVLIYGLAFVVVTLWVEARLLVVLTPVIVNERLGLKSYARAFALTKGLTWRIVGVLLLFAVVALVALFAVQGVVGVALRLLLGFQQAGLALFLTGAVVSLVGCVISVVVATFSAQLYVATRDRAMAR